MAQSCTTTTTTTKVALAASASTMRVTSGGKMRNYIAFAIRHFKDHESLVISAANDNSIVKVISIVELLKRTVPSLSQRTTINPVDVQRKGKSNRVQSSFSILLTTATLEPGPGVQLCAVPPPSS
mmetsp:Transcript_29140/g.73257  ORF Transcript_29140/g.73257 Transcript_29140/m.73257 type:complete len:125 (+) Transcript_29140:230-604(+)